MAADCRARCITRDAASWSLTDEQGLGPGAEHRHLGTVALAVPMAIHRLRDRTPDRLLEQANISYRHRSWNQAEEFARRVLRIRPSETAALRILARSSARAGKDETAEAIYRRLGTRAMEAEDLFLLGRGLLRRDPHGPGLAALGAAPTLIRTIRKHSMRSLIF